MLNQETYKNISEKCSAYDTKSGCSCSNKSGDSEVSCTTCTHFTDNHLCELDLIDPIVENHDL